MSDDLLENKRVDPVTKEVIMYGSKENWLIQPVPVLKLLKAKRHQLIQFLLQIIESIMKKGK